ncbi:MAG TPA: baseplate J/gp47 family protein, partial [Candidatus Limnocylindrales bacterium]|nr:baseplate J/gp47 family protein [Candidatus Limnocylindrales bacterium]
PRPETVGPVELTVSADPAATTVDAAGGIIPATTVSFPISVGQSFPATGKRVEESRATGQVTFDSVNTVGPVAVPSGTRVSTLGGVVFATTKGATVPKATVAGTTIKHGTVTVPVRATKAGPEGNVEGGEITQVPDFLSTQQVSANNAKATSGGKRTEFAQVTKKDVDAAVKALEVEAARAFADAVAASAGVPAGQTLFPATAVLGPLVYEPAPASLIGDEAESFELAATANGTATAVDVSQVEAIAEERLLAGIAAGAQLVPGSVEVSIGAPVITGSVVTFPVTATASQIRPVDAEDLEAEILGLSIEQAEAALARYGAVTIEVWPDLVTSIPTNDSRVTITVVGGVTPSAAPSSPPP